MADGNICYKKGILIIGLHLNTIDLPHLLKFREFVGSSHKVGIYRNKIWGNTSCSVSFACGLKMAQELGKYGFGPRKCFTARLEGGIENNKHTWRGLIDGDGTWEFIQVVKILKYLLEISKTLDSKQAGHGRCDVLH